jgi:small subunit ribosomal protein S7
MPRKGGVRRRDVLPDPKYHDRLVTRFINAMLMSGKKSVAERVFYRALDRVAERTNEDPLGIFKRALENVRPAVEVRSRRWILQTARARTEKSFEGRLAAELIDAAGGRGNAMRKKEETHRMADANKAFAHYRW